MSTGFGVSLPLRLPLSLLLFLCFPPSLRVLLPWLASRYGSPLPVVAFNSSMSIPPGWASISLPGRGSLARRGSHALPKPAIVRGVALKGEVCAFRSLLELGVGSAPPESHRPRGAVPGGKPGCCSHSWGAPTPGRQNRRAPGHLVRQRAPSRLCASDAHFPSEAAPTWSSWKIPSSSFLQGCMKLPLSVTRHASPHPVLSPQLTQKCEVIVPPTLCHRGRRCVHGAKSPGFGLCAWQATLRLLVVSSVSFKP